jgi:hypothetical protein
MKNFYLKAYSVKTLIFFTLKLKSYFVLLNDNEKKVKFLARNFKLLCTYKKKKPLC